MTLTAATRPAHADETIGATPGWLEPTARKWVAGLPGQGARTDLQPQPVDRNA